MIDIKTLIEALGELRKEISDKIYNADSNSKETRASDFYRSDQQGYSRGLYIATNHIIDKLYEKFDLKEIK